MAHMKPVGAYTVVALMASELASEMRCAVKRVR